MKALMIMASLVVLFFIWANRIGILTGKKLKKTGSYNKAEVAVVSIVDVFLFILFINMFGRTAIGIQVSAGMNILSTVFLKMALINAGLFIKQKK